MVLKTEPSFAVCEEEDLLTQIHWRVKELVSMIRIESVIGKLGKEKGHGENGGGQDLVVWIWIWL